MGFDQPIQPDALFWEKRKKGARRLVAPPNPPLEGFVADTHAHLHLLPDPVLALARCAVHGVSFVCGIVDIYEDDSAIFDQVEGWRIQAKEIAPQLLDEARAEYGSLIRTDDACVPAVRLAVGCHPHNAKNYDSALEETLRQRLADSRVAAVGEIGLDYHYDLSPREDQRRAFRSQIRLAKECGLPVALHLREAHNEAFEIMSDEGFPDAGVLLHCFNLNWEVLKPWVDAGCFVAFGGALTFKSNEETREAATHVSEDRLLIETDAPFMTPEPMRGMMCGPAHVIFTAERLAQMYGIEEGNQRKQFLNHLMENARGLLDRPATAWQQMYSEQV